VDLLESRVLVVVDMFLLSLIIVQDTHELCFLNTKNEAFTEFARLIKQVQVSKSLTIISIKSDRDRKFDEVD